MLLPDEGAEVQSGAYEDIGKIVRIIECGILDLLCSLLFHPGAKIHEIFGMLFLHPGGRDLSEFDADLHQICSSPEISCLLIFEAQIPAGICLTTLVPYLSGDGKLLLVVFDGLAGLAQSSVGYAQVAQVFPSPLRSPISRAIFSA